MGAAASADAEDEDDAEDDDDEEDGDFEEGDDDDEEDDEDDDDERDPMETALLTRIITQFAEVHGRAPQLRRGKAG